MPEVYCIVSKLHVQHIVETIEVEEEDLTQDVKLRP